jgi:hypothetical protein
MKFLYRAHYKLPLDYIMTQTNSVHTLTSPTLLNIYINIIQWCPSGLIPSRFSSTILNAFLIYSMP